MRAAALMGRPGASAPAPWPRAPPRAGGAPHGGSRPVAWWPRGPLLAPPARRGRSAGGGGAPAGTAAAPAAGAPATAADAPPLPPPPAPVDSAAAWPQPPCCDSRSDSVHCGPQAACTRAQAARSPRPARARCIFRPARRAMGAIVGSGLLERAATDSERQGAAGGGAGLASWARALRSPRRRPTAARPPFSLLAPRLPSPALSAWAPCLHRGWHHAFTHGRGAPRRGERARKGRCRRERPFRRARSEHTPPEPIRLRRCPP
jgi:hypothetical protein